MLEVVELADNDGDEEVHHEEGCDEDEGDEEQGDPVTIGNDRCQVLLVLRVRRGKHDIWPRLERRNLEECGHRCHHVVVVVGR